VRSWFVAIVPLFGSVSGVASATEASTAVSFRAPESCPTQAEVVSLVEDALGEPIATERNQVLELAAVVTQQLDGNFVLRLTTKSATGTGERFLSNGDCHRLAEAAALVMALSIDPERTEARARQREGQRENEVEPLPPPGPPEPLRAVLPPPRPLPVFAPPQPPPPQPTSPIKVFVAGRAMMGAGILPKTQGGAEVIVGVASEEGLAMRVGASAWLPRSVAIKGSDGAIDVGLQSARFDGCWAEGTTLRLYGCLGTTAGRLTATGRGVDQAHTEAALWLGALGEVGAFQPLGAGLGVVGSLTGGVSLARPRFGVRFRGESVEVTRPSWGVVQAGLGLGWVLP
jgi:hypothetical protein